MKTQSIVELVNTIEEKTREGELLWQDASLTTFPAKQLTFTTALANYTISIHEDNNVYGQDTQDYYLTIGLAGGSELESFSDGELSQITAKEGIQFKSFQMMQSIYKNARRQALGIDKAIDNLLAELKKTT